MGCAEGIRRSVGMRSASASTSQAGIAIASAMRRQLKIAPRHQNGSRSTHRASPGLMVVDDNTVFGAAAISRHTASRRGQSLRTRIDLNQVDTLRQQTLIQLQCVRTEVSARAECGASACRMLLCRYPAPVIRPARGEEQTDVRTLHSRPAGAAYHTLDQGRLFRSLAE